MVPTHFVGPDLESVAIEPLKYGEFRSVVARLGRRRMHPDGLVTVAPQLLVAQAP